MIADDRNQQSGDSIPAPTTDGEDMNWLVRHRWMTNIGVIPRGNTDAGFLEPAGAIFRRAAIYIGAEKDKGAVRASRGDSGTVTSLRLTAISEPDPTTVARSVSPLYSMVIVSTIGRATNGPVNIKKILKKSNTVTACPCRGWCAAYCAGAAIHNHRDQSAHFDARAWAAFLSRWEGIGGHRNHDE